MDKPIKLFIKAPYLCTLTRRGEMLSFLLMGLYCLNLLTFTQCHFAFQSFLSNVLSIGPQVKLVCKFITRASLGHHRWSPLFHWCVENRVSKLWLNFFNGNRDLYPLYLVSENLFLSRFKIVKFNKATRHTTCFINQLRVINLDSFLTSQVLNIRRW